jgi:transposase-like protein
MSNFFSDTEGWLKDYIPEQRSKKEAPTDEVLCVVYVPVRCPYCRSVKKIHCYSKDGKIRYHKCNNCGRKFKSVEE